MNFVTETKPFEMCDSFIRWTFSKFKPRNDSSSEFFIDTINTP